jgi:hypothetical protein
MSMPDYIQFAAGVGAIDVPVASGPGARNNREGMKYQIAPTI